MHKKSELEIIFVKGVAWWNRRDTECMTIAVCTVYGGTSLIVVTLSFGMNDGMPAACKQNIGGGACIVVMLSFTVNESMTIAVSNSNKKNFTLILKPTDKDPYGRG